MFWSNDHLEAEIYTYIYEVNFRCIYFSLKMDGRPTHAADKLNKIVNNYWNSVTLDENPWTWSNTHNRMQTPEFKNMFNVYFTYFTFGFWTILCSPHEKEIKLLVSVSVGLQISWVFKNVSSNIDETHHKILMKLRGQFLWNISRNTIVSLSKEGLWKRRGFADIE
jgi:hypothetical protein